MFIMILNNLVFDYDKNMYLPEKRNFELLEKEIPLTLVSTGTKVDRILVESDYKTRKDGDGALYSLTSDVWIDIHGIKEAMDMGYIVTPHFGNVSGLGIINPKTDNYVRFASMPRGFRKNITEANLFRAKF